MVAERLDLYPHFDPFDFYGDGRRIRTSDLDMFRQELDKLLARQRPKWPYQPGTLLLLRKDARFERLQTLLRIIDRLVKNGFQDHHNWVLEDRHDPVRHWTNRVALDVVGLPAYSDKDGRNFLLRGNSWSYRLFTRPSYIPKDGTNK